MEQEPEEVEPVAEPAADPSDPHSVDLEDEEDARFLDPADPRRLAVERERGRPFTDDDLPDVPPPDEPASANWLAEDTPVSEGATYDREGD